MATVSAAGAGPARDYRAAMDAAIAAFAAGAPRSVVNGHADAALAAAHRWFMADFSGLADSAIWNARGIGGRNHRRPGGFGA